MARSLTLDSRVESAANAPLELWANDDTSIVVTDLSAPTPPLDTATSGSIDTEGDAIAARRHQNRQVSLTLEVTEPADAAATNLVTNPSFEVDTAGWTASNSTIARTSVAAFAGSYALAITAANTNSAVAYFDITVVAGDVCAVSARFRTASVSRSAKVTMQWLDGSNAQVGVTTEGNLVTTTTSGWLESSAVQTAPVGAVKLRLICRGSTSSTAGEVYYLDGAHVEKAAALAGSYFDGDTPGCAWSGTPHASASTRPAPGGARFDAILNDLSGKVAKVAAEGGTLRFCDAEGNPRTLDLLAAQSYEPQFDVKYFLANAATVAVSFMAAPYARGDKITLSLHTETTLPLLTFTETILGDIPALCDLVVNETESQGQLTALWAVRSQNYDASAPLLIEGESMISGIAGTSSTADATASGGTVASRAVSGGLPFSGSLMTAADGLTHVGTYRVYARVRSSAVGSGTQSLRARWQSNSTGNAGTGTLNPNFNATATIDRTSTNWWFVDLGFVTFQKAARGTQSSYIWLEASGTGTLYLDYLALFPVDEGFGIASRAGSDVLVSSGEGIVFSATDGVLRSAEAVWESALNYVGDRPVIPVSGPEGRPVQFAVKMSETLIGSAGDDIDNLSAQASYTPRYFGLL